MAGAAQVATDRVVVAADKASTTTALVAAQALVGTAGTGTATGLVYAGQVRNLVTAGDVVAVHVYDTARDSDGGAWTERCRGASWYNEALNTAGRGATRRFPRVALIVARAASLTIYDAHDLDGAGVPRMWMVFTVAAASWAAANVLAESSSAVHTLNGRMWVTSTGGTYGMVEVDFPNDRVIRRSGSGGYGGRYRGVVAGRNVGAGYAQDLTAIQALAATACAHVHARVLPGAPVDNSGLPIPTVAVATAGGVSVIHPWGAVYDITRTGGYYRVLLTPDGRLLTSRTDGSLVEYGRPPYADAANTAWRAGVYTNGQIVPNGVSCVLAPGAAGTNGGSGVTQLAEDVAVPGNGMVAYTAINHATCWQPGDIRCAHLCDTTVGAIATLGDLITNGEFGADTTGWSAVNGAALSVVGNRLRVTNTSANGAAVAALATVVGQTYLVSLDVGAVSGGVAFVGVGTVAGVNNVLAATALSALATAAPVQFSAAASVSYLNVGNISASVTSDFDAVSVRLALPDRSYKGRGLAVVGSLSRTALPCGLAYVSGYSLSSYLDQPYNSDLDFGAGDFCFMAWLFHAAGGSIRTIADRAQVSSPYSNPFISLETSATDFPRMFIRDAAGVQNSVTSGVALPAGQWSQVAWVSRGAMLEMWVDGARTATAARTAAGSLSNVAALLRIGLGVDGARPYPGGVALLRSSAYAPTPAQMRRMHDDERALIVGGAPALLGGTSNNVAALAQDAATGLLHVGTADGISQFDRLARISYLDAGNSGPALASDSILSVSAAGGHMVVATSGNAGYIADTLIARDRMATPGIAAGPRVDVIQAGCVTADATPTSMAPRIHIGEREAVTLDVTVQARTYGATSTHGGTYRRIARYVRDAGGNVTLAGSIQTIGSDQETTGTMDMTLLIDTAAQTVTPHVTGVAATRMVWTARITVTRINEDQTYAA